MAFECNLLVTLNGQTLPNLLEAAISRNNCFAADTFELTFAITDAPETNLTFWSTLLTAYVEIQDRTLQRTIISGMMDGISLNLTLGVVSLEGRDLSASLVDGAYQQDFVNQTASEVVSTIAAKHGLASAVAPTRTYVGRFFDDNHTKLSLGLYSRIRSDWDLVVQLARENGFDAYVEDRTLYFQPEVDQSAPTYLVNSDKVKRLRIERFPQTANAGDVRVLSWNAQSRAAYQQDTDSPVRDGRFYFAGTNLTPDQVARSAEQYAKEVRRLTTLIQIDMTWDAALSPRQAIWLTTGEANLDGLYRIDSIDRWFSSTRGSSQIVRGSRLNISG